MKQQTASKLNKEISNGRYSDAQNKSWIVYLSTFPPRQCGIATFTSDLTNATDQMFGPSVESKIIAMNLSEVSSFPYPEKVILQINQHLEEDYSNAAMKINQLNKVKLVNVQHEFGIFGGKYGTHLLSFLKKLQKPVVTTFHTVLPAPNKKMLGVVQAIAQHSQGIIVMTRSSKEILVKDYGLNTNQIKVIPHGIHHIPYRASTQAKSALGFSDKLTLSTFGLLSPNKGIEYVIEALPPVVEKFPHVRFLVAGVTHPVVLEKDGESYRHFLTTKVKQLGLSGNVSFYNTYLGLNDLLKFLEATDIYLSTSLDPNQTVSGTLSYALGVGRPVISTAFAQAKQDVTKGVGVLVDFKKPRAFTDAIIKILKNNALRLQMGKRAYFRTRYMAWENVALSYLKYFSQFVPEQTLRQRKLPPIKLAHLAKLTDDFGIIQFAQLTEPDLSSGYTLDDNARALIVATLHYQKFKAPSSLKLASIYLNFLRRVTRPDGLFDNYVNQNRTIDTQRNLQEYSEDSSARCLYALALVATASQIPKHLRHEAHSLFEQSLRKNIAFSSPRAIAFYTKALYCFLSKWPGLGSYPRLASNNDGARVSRAGREPKALAVLRRQCELLVNLFAKSRSHDWEWFEHYLTYSNATLPEALLLGYKITGEEPYLEVANKTLNFLIEHTFSSKGAEPASQRETTYIPIGQSGWFPKGGARQYFDQQPEDTTATIQALNTMFQLTSNKRYEALAYAAFNWFLGDNVLGQVVYDRTTGGCYDGVGNKSINLNQGAESTISYLLARLSFEN
ncbi:MAG: glycosyltransferase [bacterium]|nr:glycosyltransferase [bacterium]